MTLEGLKKYKEYLGILNYSTNTIKSYEIAILQYYNFLYKIKKEVETITDEEIYLLIDEMKKYYKFTTINLKLSAIKHYYKFRKIEFPADVFIRNERPMLYPLSDKEIKCFKNWLNAKEERIKLPLEIMLNTGIRINELTKLEIEDFIEIDKKQYIKINNTKNYSSRIIPINKSLTERTLKYYDDNIYFGKIFDFTKRNYQYHIKQFSKEYNIDTSLHTLRRTYATYLQSRGTKVEVIQKLLGHKNITTTMIYIKITDEEIQKLDPLNL